MAGLGVGDRESLRTSLSVVRVWLWAWVLTGAGLETLLPGSSCQMALGPRIPGAMWPGSEEAHRGLTSDCPEPPALVSESLGVGTLLGLTLGCSPNCPFFLPGFQQPLSGSRPAGADVSPLVPGTPVPLPTTGQGLPFYPPHTTSPGAASPLTMCPGLREPWLACSPQSAFVTSPNNPRDQTRITSQVLKLPYP